MGKNLHDLRKSYEKDALLEQELSSDPYKVFDQWFQAAQNDPAIEEANAMSISTLGTDGFPKSRIVLLKEIENEKLIFYSNYSSEKAQAIEKHPKVCLHFFWPSLERQVIIKAAIAKTSREKSQSYFNSRPRGSQLGAWTSNQSAAVSSREKLEEQLHQMEQKFDGKEIPLPDFWGGYECLPLSFEFWQGRPNRLHDRILYTIENDQWSFKRLQP